MRNQGIPCGMVTTTRRVRPASPDTPACFGIAATKFQCPACGGALKRTASDGLDCQSCGHDVAVQDGIVDFVAGSAGTSLDDIDYDAFYGIDAEHSLKLYNVLLRATGPRWPRQLGDTMEVGCGTGGLSLELFSRIAAKSVVLTDISPKMLRICRERLRQAIPDRAEGFAFATYSGSETCFRAASFDSCVGSAVVHHIVDVPLFLRQVQALLKPTGFAFFMEPNRAFHSALTRTMADVLADFLRYDTAPHEDISRMMNWMAEVHCSVVNAGDMEVLAEREDKHYFVDSTFLAWAREAGFDGVEALPCDPDPTGWSTAQNYMGQCHIRPAAFETLRRAWPSYYKQYFSDLKPADRSPSYCFWLKKGVTREGFFSTPGPTSPVRNAPVEIQLDTKLTSSADAVDIVIEGWCLADRPVGSLQFSTGTIRRRLPVWLPRGDVELAMNPNGAYPALNALCSGVRGTIRLPALPDTQAGIALSVQVVFEGGDVLDTATLTVAGDGATQSFHCNVPP
jgi:ubiquinone/menaquinone biosynthesis C-methylase UbiE/predicted RNA-binding Zn-ribbon protein involved in translation (DUF1610 family)